MAAWQLGTCQVGPPARWAATSNVGRREWKGGDSGPLAREGGLYLDKLFLVTPLLVRPVCLLSQGRCEEPVRSWYRVKWVVAARSSTVVSTRTG